MKQMNTALTNKKSLL